MNDECLCATTVERMCYTAATPRSFVEEDLNFSLRVLRPCFSQENK